MPLDARFAANECAPTRSIRQANNLKNKEVKKKKQNEIQLILNSFQFCDNFTAFEWHICMSYVSSLFSTADGVCDLTVTIEAYMYICVCKTRICNAKLLWLI